MNDFDKWMSGQGVYGKPKPKPRPRPKPKPVDEYVEAVDVMCRGCGESFLVPVEELCSTGDYWCGGSPSCCP